MKINSDSWNFVIVCTYKKLWNYFKPLSVVKSRQKPTKDIVGVGIILVFVGIRGWHDI